MTIEDWPLFDANKFHLAPPPTTLTKHATYPIHTYSIVIDLNVQLLLCLCCKKAITPLALYRHVKAHFPELDVDPKIGEVLADEFQLDSSSDYHFPTDVPPPVYGLDILPDARFFCDRCAHGFSTEVTLRSHQAQKDVCPRRPNEDDAYFIAYGQSFGFDSSVFPVNTEKLPLHTDTMPSALSLFSLSTFDTPDFSSRPISLPVNFEDLDVFFTREKWVQHVVGFTPVELEAASVLPPETNAAPSQLVQAVRQYMQTIKEKIDASTGVMKLIAQVGSAASQEEFRAISNASLLEYGRELIRLLHNTVEAAVGRPTRYAYPLSPSQTDALAALSRAFEDRPPRPHVIAPLLHLAVFSLFAQKKKNGSESNFTLPSVCFLVARSMGPTAWRRADFIHRVAAQLTWINRGTILYEMHVRMRVRNLSTMEAYDELKDFLLASYDTPGAYFYNCASVLRTIQDDYNPEDRNHAA
ncbi:hypothetical protein DFH06DRAFT_111760 [Mycena polygramma]|nr:hypothetical protein DFH06DRAFT_111760 [Mycena polygramma]